jgi:RimJ/RimL family protein N-acetyltransferase
MRNNSFDSRLPNKPYVAGLAVPVRELHNAHRDEILRHLLLLNEEDRRLRFGTQTPNEVIHHYVEGLDFNKDALFGSFDAQLNLVGMAHLAYLPESEKQVPAAEFGVSVLPAGRGQGIGTALLARAAVHSRNTRIEKLLVHCLTHNKAMMHIAHKVGMQVEYAYGDADAYLRLKPANAGTFVEEASNEQWADFDYAIKKNFKRTNDALFWFFGKRKARPT